MKNLTTCIIYIRDGVVFYNDVDGRKRFGLLSDDCSKYTDIGFVQDLEDSFQTADFSQLKSEISCATDGKRAFTFYDSKAKANHLFVYKEDGEVDAIVPYVVKVWAYNGQIYIMSDLYGNKLQEELVISHADGYITSVDEYMVPKEYDFFEENNYIELKKVFTGNSVIYDLEAQKEVTGEFNKKGDWNTYYMVDGSVIQYFDGKLYEVKENETIKKITDKYRVSNFKNGDNNELVIMDLSGNELVRFNEDEVLEKDYYFGIIRLKNEKYYSFEGEFLYQDAE